MVVPPFRSRSAIQWWDIAAGAQTGRRGGAGPAGGLLGGKDPAGRVLVSSLLAAAAAAADPRHFCGPLEAGKSVQFDRVGREDRADGPARAGRQRVLHYPARFMVATEQ